MTKKKQPDQRKARAKASGEQIPNSGEKGNASSGTQKMPWFGDAYKFLL